MKEESLISECTTRVTTMCKGKHLLVIQDTTEINLQNHAGRLKPGNGLGPVGNNTDVGFFLHPSLVLDASTLTPLGFSSIDICHRSWDKADRYSRGYRKLPIEEKESFKWLRSSEISKQNLIGSEFITIIQDREGDIYDQFARVPDHKTHLLIRVSFNRKLNNSEEKLFDYLEQQPIMTTYDLDIENSPRKNRKARKAKMELKYSEVEIKCPATASKKNPKTIKLYAVEAKESKDTVPEGERAICWRILTTHTIETPDQAKTIIDWYSHRWFIEQVFRLIKSKGFAIENSELETGWALRKLTVLVLQSVLKICQMMLAYGKEESQPITEVFNKQEINCLEKLNQKLDGKTDKNKNPYPRDGLSWATWVIARLGGWNGYKSERPPGPITLKNGFDQFNTVFQGWILAQ